MSSTDTSDHEKNIMLIEDDRDIAVLLRSRLADRGYNVVVPSLQSPIQNFIEAINNTIALEGVSLIICDLHFPTLDKKTSAKNGIDVIRGIRKKNQHVKIVVMSGKVRDEQIDPLRKIGVDFTIEKHSPKAVDILLSTVRKMVGLPLSSLKGRVAG